MKKEIKIRVGIEVETILLSLSNLINELRDDGVPTEEVINAIANIADTVKVEVYKKLKINKKE